MSTCTRVSPQQTHVMRTARHARGHSHDQVSEMQLEKIVWCNQVHRIAADVRGMLGIAQKICVFAIGSIAALLCILSPAMAGVAAPPEESPLDSGGVDVSAGGIDLSAVDVTIGPVGAGGLVFSRRYVAEAWRPNTVGTINVSGSVYTVTLGGDSETFTLSGGNYDSNQAEGSTLTYNSGNQTYTYTLSNGVAIIFDKAFAGLDMPWDANEARITSIAAPNGESTTFHYKTVTVSSVNYGRLQSVTNNRGYQLHFTYALNGPTSAGQIPDWMRVTIARGINNAVDWCNPSADTCSGFTETWPSATYTGAQVSLASATNALSQTTNYYYSSGRLSAVRYPGSGSNNLSITYGGSGRVYTRTDGVGTWTYTYSDAGGARTTTMTDPLSHTNVTISDLATGRVTSETNGVGQTTSYQRDGYGRVTRVTAPEGNYVQYAYDSRGNVTSVTRVAKSGSGLSNIVTSASYPGTCTNPVTCNLPTSTTDARGNTTSYTYNSTHGGVLTVTSPAVGGVSPKATYSYSQHYAWYRTSSSSTLVQGAAIYLLDQTSMCATSASCANAAEEAVTEFDYEAGSASLRSNLLPISTTTRSGNSAFVSTTDATYDAIGNVKTVNGPLSGTSDTTQFHYDALRRPIGVIGPDPDGGGGNPHPARRIAYHTYGMANSVEMGTASAQTSGALSAMTVLAQQTATIDAQTARQTRADSFYGGVRQSVMQTTYDNAGRVDCMATRMNPAVFTSLPSSACTLGTLGANGPDRIAKNVYDNANRVTSMLTAYGVSGQQATEFALAYTNNGLRDWIEDANGNRTNYTYDGHDRLYRQEYPSSTIGAHAANSSDYEQFGYDAAGNVTSLRLRSSESIAFTYDVLNRQTLMNLPGGSSSDVYYAYDLLNRPLSARFASAGGDGVVYSYATPGVVTETDTIASPDRTLTSTFDARGLRTRLTYPDHIGGSNDRYIDYTYDVLGRPLQVRENGATSGAGLLASYSYDASGRVSSVARAGGGGVATNFTYDTNSRDWTLAQNFSGSTYDIDFDFTANAAGQILTRTPDNPNFDYAPPSTDPINYTRNGLNQYTAVGGASFTHTDGRGNLTSDGSRTFAYDLLNRLTSVSGSASMTLAYDPLGRLRQTASGGTTRQYLYDGNALVMEYDGSNAVQHRYAHGAGSDNPLVWYSGTGLSNKRWLISDQQGTIIADAGSNGDLSTSNVYSYSAFGEPHVWTGLRFRYTGQIALQEVGLYYYKARVYDPVLGRFLQTDPIGYAGGMNLYAYVGNDPVNFGDPSGLRKRTRTGSIIPGVTAIGRIYCSGNCLDDVPGVGGSGAREGETPTSDGGAGTSDDDTVTIRGWERVTCNGAANEICVRGVANTRIELQITPVFNVLRPLYHASILISDLNTDAVYLTEARPSECTDPCPPSAVAPFGFIHARVAVYGPGVGPYGMNNSIVATYFTHRTTADVLASTVAFARYVNMQNLPYGGSGFTSNTYARSAWTYLTNTYVVFPVGVATPGW